MDLILERMTKTKMRMKMKMRTKTMAKSTMIPGRRKMKANRKKMRLMQRTH